MIETKVVADGRTTTAAERGIMKVMDMMTPAANEGIDQRLACNGLLGEAFPFSAFLPILWRVRISALPSSAAARLVKDE